MFIKKKWIVIYFALLISSLWFSTIAFQFGWAAMQHEMGYQQAALDLCMERLEGTLK